MLNNIKQVTSVVTFWVDLTGLSICLQHRIQQNVLRKKGWENQGQKLCKGGIQAYFFGRTSGSISKASIGCHLKV